MVAKESLFKYVSPSKEGLILGVFGVLVGIMGLFTKNPLGIFLFGVGCAAVFSGSTLFEMYKISKQMKNFELNGELEDVLKEFEEGVQVLNDSIRLGNKYAFGKKTGTIIKYEDISRMYQYVYKTNLIESSRTIKIENISKVQRELCRLPLKGTADNEVKEIMMFILAKNPKIEIGYK